MPPTDCNHIHNPIMSFSCSECGEKASRHVNDMSREELIQNILRLKSVVTSAEAYFRDLWARYPEIVKNDYQYTCPFMQDLHDRMRSAGLLWDIKEE